MADATSNLTSEATQDTAWSVLVVFLRLGLTSFGGPVAHLGYFRDEFVERRRWLDEATYADLVALCQFLPGPASSQVGIAHRPVRAPAMPARSRPGSASRCRRRSRWSLFAYGVGAFGDRAGARLAARAEGRGRRRRRAGGARAWRARWRPTASAPRWRSSAAVIVLAVPSALGPDRRDRARRRGRPGAAARRRRRPSTPPCRCASSRTARRRRCSRCSSRC